jgi:hypothetical protein
MKNDINASVAFAKDVARAGLDAVKTLGQEVEKLGEDVEKDETPLQLASAAVLGFQRAQANFFKGAVAAAQTALKTRRTGAPPPEVSPIFWGEDINTVAISGLVDYAKLKRKMQGSEYLPALIDDGTGQDKGVVHLFFDKVGNTRFEGYNEILFLASANPAESPQAPVKLKEPFDIMYPAFHGAPNFVLRVLIDAGDEARTKEVIRFGREVLGLEKEAMGGTTFQVDGEELDVNLTSPGKLNFNLRFLAKDAKPAPSFPPGVKPFYSVVTKAARQEFYRTWSWVFSAKSPAKCNNISAGAFTYPKTKDTIWAELHDLEFDGKLSTWTSGLAGGVENLAVVGPPPPTP